MSNAKTALVNEPTRDAKKLASGLKWVSVRNEDGQEVFSSYYTTAKTGGAAMAKRLLLAKIDDYCECGEQRHKHNLSYGAHWGTGYCTQFRRSESVTVEKRGY